jgi:hypothetical protein
MRNGIVQDIACEEREIDQFAHSLARGRDLVQSLKTEPAELDAIMRLIANGADTANANLDAFIREAFPHIFETRDDAQRETATGLLR